MSISRTKFTGMAIAGAALSALAGCAQPQMTTPAPPPIPAGQARLWFYREYQPSVSFNVANIDANGVPLISVPAYGPGLYRDVPPGQYRIVPQGEIGTARQVADVSLAPGQEAFLEIDDSPLLEGDRSVYKRDVFYVKPVPAEIARAQIGLAR